MSHKINALIVQGTQKDTLWVESVLFHQYQERLHIQSSFSVEDALERLEIDSFDVILLSERLSDTKETKFAIRMLSGVAGIPVLSIAALHGKGSSEVYAQLCESSSAHSAVAYALATCVIDPRCIESQNKEVLHQLKISEERYALAIESAKDGIWDWDLNYNTVYYSQQWEAMLGLEKSIMTDLPCEWLNRVHPDDIQRLERALTDHLAHRCPSFCCEYRMQHNQGHYIWVLGRGGALRNAMGKAYRIVGSQIDISRHKQLEQSLAEEKEMAKVILESMGDAVITTDDKGRIMDFNPEAEKLTGWQASAAKHQPVANVCRLIDSTTRQPMENPADIVLEKGKVVSMSSHPTLVSKDGQEIEIDDSAAPIRDKEGQLIGSVMVFRDVSVERGRSRQLAWQAAHDPLTGLANRQHFVEQLERISKQAGHSRVVCYLDLDHFKVVNDSCGHAAGDELLRQVAALLTGNTRRSDLLARLGGDEFGLIIYDCPADKAHGIASKLCDAVQKFRFHWQGKVFSIGVSIGLVPIPTEGAPAERLMSLADAACYAAKNKGRNQVQVYSKENEHVMQLSADLEWFTRINQAIEEDSFCLYYQEIKPTVVGKETIREILLRLPDKRTKHIMPPMAFIPPAERYDLMPKLDRWAIRQCFKQIMDISTPGVLYSINLSGDTLNDDNFVAFLREALNEFHIDPHRICFEITETTAIANLTQVATMILSLKKLGFRFALDDFGSGMSSFVYLKQLPVDYLKIDGSLVSEINRDEIALATLKSINDIGHIMGLSTVAEYVSDSDILQTVEALNIDYMQGFEIAIPLPLSDITASSEALLSLSEEPAWIATA
ncbi:MAG: EAL domain-containing protein [Cyanobacteria bacterium J06621_3]